MRIILLILVPLISWGRSVSKNGIESYVDKYFEDQLTQSIHRIAPDVKFSLLVRTSLNQNLLKSVDQVEKIKLPLGGSFLSSEEMTSQAGPEGLMHPESYREALSSITVEISWQESLSPVDQEWLKKHIISDLRLSADVAHDVKFSALPETFIKSNSRAIASESAEKIVWLEKVFPQLAGISPQESAAVVVAGSVFVLGLLGFLFKLLVTSGQLFSFTKTFKESVTKVVDSISAQGQAAGGASLPLISQPLAQTNDRSQTPIQSFLNANKEKFWDNVHAPELKAFAYDCLEHPLFESAAIILVHNFLNPTQADELKNALPDHFFDVDGPGRVLAPAHEVEEMFVKNRLQYVLLAERPLVQSLLSYSVPQSIRLIEKLVTEEKSIEALSIMNRLTPIKREIVFEKLSFEFRLKLAQWSELKIEHAELEKAEEALAHSLRRPLAQEIQGRIVDFPFKAIGEELIKSRSFEEDEAIHNYFIKAGKFSQSILLGLTHWNDNIWSGLPLNEVALAYSGYSEEVQAKLLEKFDQKRQDWLTNFIQKYKQAGVRWDSVEVVQVRQKFMKLLPLDLEATSVDNEKNEEPPQIDDNAA